VLRINDAVGRKRPRDSGEPLRPVVVGMPASDVAARELSDAEFQSLATGAFPAMGRGNGSPDGAAVPGRESTSDDERDRDDTDDGETDAGAGSRSHVDDGVRTARAADGTGEDGDP
jgi:hypothetical protein